MNYIKIAITYFACFSLSVTTFANDNEVMPPTGEQQQQKSCQQYRQEIVSQCSQNPTLMDALNDKNNAANTATQVNNGNGETTALMNNTETGIKVGNAGKQKMTAAKQQCERAGQQCQDRCRQEEQDDLQKAADARKPPMPNEALASQHDQRARTWQEYRHACKQEQETSVAKTENGLEQLAQILQALAGLLQSLGGQPGEDSELADVDEDEEGDVCEGPDADLYLKCLGDSDPIASRAGVSGSTGVGSLSGQDANSLFGAAGEGEPGGEGSGSSPTAASGFNGQGLSGGFGNLGLPGSSIGSSSGEKDKLNADIYKGYMSGGDSGGIGSYGGGGGGGGRMSASSFKPSTASSLGKNRLQSALDKIATSGKRGPASLDATNGPMQNIWGVVNKTYKKTSPSMYHKE